MIAGTAGETIHALDGLRGHDSDASIAPLHVYGGGVSDLVFAVPAIILTHTDAKLLVAIWLLIGFVQDTPNRTRQELPLSICRLADMCCWR